MEIKVLKTFLDGRERYIKDEIRKDVADEDGKYFCACGWAEDTSGETPTGELQPGKVKLDIRNVKHSHKAETVGG